MTTPIERAPQQHQPDLRGDERPQHELSGRQTHSSRDDSRARRGASSCAAAPACREPAAADDPLPSRARHGFIRCCHRASERRVPPRFDRRRRRTRPTCRRSRAAAPPRGGCRRAVARGARARDAAAGCAAAPRTSSESSGTPSAPTRLTRAGQRVAIDHDLDEVVVPNAPDRSVVQRLGPDVADAGAAREPGEPAVGDERHVFAPGQVTERRGDLRGLLHAGPRRPHADQHDDVALAHRSGRRSLDGLDRLALVGEHPRRTAMTIDAIGVDHRRIDRGGLDHRALRREVAARKHDRAGQPGAACGVRRHDDLIRIDGRGGREPCACGAAPLARFPPVERGVERVAGRREHAPVQQAHAAEMQHHFRNAAGHEHLRRRETRAVRSAARRRGAASRD